MSLMELLGVTGPFQDQPTIASSRAVFWYAAKRRPRAAFPSHEVTP
jgi:hypothetical protein